MPQHLRLFVDTQFASPYAMSVFVALREKGLDFELSTVDLAAQGAGAGPRRVCAGRILGHR